VNNDIKAMKMKGKSVGKKYPVLRVNELINIVVRVLLVDNKFQVQTKR